MKPEIIEIIKSIIDHSIKIDIDKKYISLSILRLKDKWPGLTLDEQKEIENVAYLLEADVDVNNLLDDVFLTHEEYYPAENNEYMDGIKKFINRFSFKRNN